LDVRIDPDTLAATTAGPLFATYSKNPTLAFDNAARLERRAQAEPAIAAIAPPHAPGSRGSRSRQRS
jgi:hypothetical protein